MSEDKIKKRIIAGHESQDDLKSKYEEVKARKVEIKLKIEDPETKMLNKINRWNSIALDCRALVASSKQENPEIETYKPVFTP